MAKIAVGLVLRERLGESGARELTDFVERHSDEVRAEVMETCTMRVTALSVEIAEVKTELSDKIGGVKTELSDRIADVKTELSGKIADVKTELSEKIADLRTDVTKTLAEMRVEILRWTFVFWIGQFAAMFAALALFAEWIRP